MSAIDRFAPLGGRILLSFIFIMSGFNKITDFGGTADYMGAVGMPMPQVLLVIAIILELGGALYVLLGFMAKIGAAALILFTLVATYYFHPAWANPDEMIPLMKNMAIMGGLLYVIAHGPGAFSFDNRSKGRAPPV